RPGAPAREQGSAVGLHGQADDDPEEPGVQRVVLRLLDLLEAARGRREAEGGESPARRPERDLHHQRGGRGRPHRLGGVTPRASPASTWTLTPTLSLKGGGSGGNRRRDRVRRSPDAA